MTTRFEPRLSKLGTPGYILEYNQDGYLVEVPNAAAGGGGFDIDALPTVQDFLETDVLAISVGGTESKISTLDFKAALEDIVLPTPPVNPGEVVNYADSTLVTAPNQIPVTAYNVQSPVGAGPIGLRLQFFIFDTGSNPQWRSSIARIYVNNVFNASYNTGSGSSLLVNHDIFITGGDVIKITVAVYNADQSPYINANIQDFFIKADTAPIGSGIWTPV